MEWVKDQSNRYGWLKKSLRGAKRWKVPRVVTTILLLAELTLFCFTLLICIDLIASFQKLMSADYGVPKKADQEVLLRQVAKQEGDYVANNGDRSSEGEALLRTSTI